MRPIFTVEFRARHGDVEFADESVTLNSPDELFQFVAPDGGCESIPDSVDEIHLALLAPRQAEPDRPLRELPATLQLGMVFISGPLGTVIEILDQIDQRAENRQLSDAFLKVIGA